VAAAGAALIIFRFTLAIHIRATHVNQPPSPRFPMSKILRSIVMASALLALAGCQQDAPTQQTAAPTQLSAPTDNNSQAWKLYLSSVAKQNMDGIRSSPFFYTLPPDDAPDFEEQYDRQLDNVTGTVARGVLPGNMLAFGSLSADSTRVADLAMEAFAEAPANSMRDVKVLFIGRPEHADRVREAVEPSGATFVFADITR
jgi:hypothetical protein